ncbi:MAG TPA: GNAT family N-acetyltransferase [Actinomycetota bacterium]|nr:GNAT family N-acetyltransferase [Actinomycetota bacterium]
MPSASTIRPITPEEIPVCSRIFYEAMNELHVRKHLPAEDGSDDAWIRTALGRGLRTDPGSTLLALDGDEPVAFGSASRRGDYWFLAFLFVLPTAQARGVGRSILDVLLPADRADLRLATVVESFQPVSTGLYASFGMTPRTPMYRLTGLRDPSALPPLPNGVTAEPLTEDLLDACAPLTREVLGFERPDDLRDWLGDAVTARAYRRRDGGVIGYGFLDGENWTSPVASTDEPLSAAIVGDLLRGTEAPQEAKIGVLGWSGTLLRTLLGAGMRIDQDPYIYCATDTDLPHPAYTPYAAFLP